METAQIDDLLDRYEAAERRIAANLVELDAHPTYTLLTAGPLNGQTAAKFASAMRRAPQLWDWLATLQTTLRSARTLRDGGRMNEERRTQLAAILAEPTVVLSRSTKPVAERGLLDDGETVLTVTIEQLLTQMRTTYGPIRDAVAEIDALWRELLPRLDAATTTIDRLEATTTALRMTEPTVIDAQNQLRRLRSELADDPLSVSISDGTALDQVVASAAKAVAAAKAGFDQLDGDLAGTETRLGELRVLRGRAEATYVEAAQKVRDPHGLIHPPTAKSIDGPGGLAERADQLLALDGEWRTTRQALDTWIGQVDQLRAQLQRAVTANEAPLERRSELRGLLSAYWVKAAAIGSGEDPALTDLYDLAYNELYTAPTDLDRGEVLVGELGAAMRAG